MSMKICEIFRTLSGEGLKIGYPTTYVRTYGCNMTPICPFCDTKYSVDSKEYKIMSEHEVFEEIQRLDTTNLTFTGGEPFLQFESIEIIMRKVWNRLGNYEIQFQFETNGKLYKKLDYWEDICTVSISPKLHAIDNEYIQSLKNWRSQGNINRYFKFVYEGLETVKNIKKLEKDMNGFGTLPIYLMPEGRGFNKKVYQECYEICIKNNWRLSPRMQCIVWDDAKGK